MKIAFASLVLLSLTAVANHYWESFWFMFKYQSVVSQDRGDNWQFFDFDDPVPSANGNPYYIKEAVPKEPLDGNTISFVGELGPGIKMNINLIYKYEFSDASAYMEVLSGVAWQTAARANLEVSPTVWQSAKGLFIDRVIREVASSPEVLQANGIGDAGQKGMEERVMRRANARLSAWGIRLTSVISS